jgi:hypothetical protein
MGVIERYQVNASNPSTVGGTGTTIKYFSSNPPQSLWNVGQPGVNAPITNSQLGATPSASSANGQLSFDSVAQKVVGGRFRMYATGNATLTGTPTLTATIQINTGTIATPSYATFLGGVASNAVVTTVPLQWFISGDLTFDAVSGTLGGFMKYGYLNGAGGGTDKLVAESSTGGTSPVVTVTGLTAGGLYASQFGFVVGVTFSTSTAANTSNLTEFSIVQD